MKEQWRKELQRKLADYQKPAPEVSWTEIEQAVAAAGKPATTVPMWVKRMAAAAVILLVAGIGFWLFRYQNTVADRQMEAARVIKTTGHKDALQPAGGPDVSVAEVVPVAENRYATPLTAKAAISPGEETIHTGTEPAAASERMMAEHAPKLPTDTVAMQAGELPVQGTGRGSGELTNGNGLRQQGYNRAVYAARHAIVDSRLTAKVYLSNAMGSNAQTDAFTPMLASAAPFGKYAVDMGGAELAELRNMTDEAETDIRHRHPVRFGLSFRYSLGGRWSLESGFCYSGLVSDITKKTGSYTYETEQKLSYIGIPLNASYQLWGNKSFRFYASAGVMAEKMVSGSATTHTQVGGSRESTATERVSIRPLQFSVNGGFGAECQIGKTFGIYAEPGLDYHFGNGSSLPTLYKDKPLNGRLNIGLRINFD